MTEPLSVTAQASWRADSAQEAIDAFIRANGHEDRAALERTRDPQELSAESVEEQ